MAKDYDTLLFRLTNILTKLSNNEQPNVKELAEEFNVSVRTIQRDLYSRLNKFPIIVNNNKKLQFLDGFTLNRTKLNTEEIMTVTLSLELIKNKGTEFNKASNKLMNKFMYQSIFNPYYIKPTPSEQIDTNSSMLNTIEDAIERKNCIELTFKSTNKSILSPLKIMNFEGFWYLLSQKENIVTIDMISQIQSIEILNNKFNITEEEKNLYERIHTPFFQQNESFKVKIKATSKIAHYFKLKNFLPSQKIIEESSDGSITISYKVSHIEEIDNLIKSFLPDVIVLEPKKYREQLLKEMNRYISDTMLSSN